MDQEFSRKLRKILEGALCVDDKARREIDRDAKPSEAYLEALLGTRREALFCIIFALSTGWIAPLAIAYGLHLFDLVSQRVAEILFWTGYLFFSSVIAASHAVGFAMERTVFHARAAERAERHVSRLTTILAEVEANWPGSVPPQVISSTFDLDEPTPLIDRALKSRMRRP